MGNAIGAIDKRHYKLSSGFNALLRLALAIFAHQSFTMLKKLLLVLCCFACVQAMAQENADNTYTKPSRDYVMLQLGYDMWLNTPDSVKADGLNRSANIYLCYDFPIKSSHFSFAAGVGIASSNMFFDKQQVSISDTGTQIRFIDQGPTTDSFKRFKMNSTYLEAPFELRYFTNKDNRNKGFKAAIGLKVGALLNNHTKGKLIYNNKPIIFKESTRRFLEPWRVSASLRLGYGNFSVYGQYALNPLFRVNNGPADVTPVSIGICLSGL